MYISIVWLLLWVAGCKSKYPAGVMEPQQIKPVLFDVMVATQVKQLDTTTATRQHLRDSITLEIHRVLKAHKVDDSLYFRSMAFYEAHPNQLKELLDSTRSYGNRLQDSMRKKRLNKQDTAANSAPGPKSLKPRLDSGLKPLKKPVNPTVKEQRVPPVEKVKKVPEKL